VSSGRRGQFGPSGQMGRLANYLTALIVLEGSISNGKVDNKSISKRKGPNIEGSLSRRKLPPRKDGSNLPALFFTGLCPRK